MSPRRQNERSFHEIEMQEMRQKIQLLQETVKVQQALLEAHQEDLMMIMTPVVTLHHLEAVAHTDVNLE